MAHRRNNQLPADGNGDPFRAYLARAMEELLEFAKRSDRRWEEQEQRWKDDRLERFQDREDFVRILQKIERRIDEGTALTISALKQVTVGLKDVAAELRAIRRTPHHGPNGRG